MNSGKRMIQNGLLIMGVLSIHGSVEGESGTTAVPFLSMGVGARALAMGEAATAAANDPTSLYWNPGSLTRMEGHSAIFMRAATLEDSSLDYAAYGRGNGTSAWGIGLQYFSAGVVDQTDLSGTTTGSITPNDVALTGGYARTVAGYSVGVAAKYVQSKLVDTARTMAADGGVMSPAFWNDRLRFGGSVANLGGGIKYDQESAPLPLTFRGGLEARPWTGWTGALDVVAPKGENVHMAFGAEYRLVVGADISLALRGGYNSRESTGGSAEGLSAGLGFGWRKLTVDYAFVSRGDLDPGQVLSVGYGF